jgi:hypothetical protein
MKRIKKAMLLIIRKQAHKRRHERLYYWAHDKLYELRGVDVMPGFYYRWLYQVSMWMVAFSSFHRLADWTIHMIPLHIRFDEAGRRYK